MSTSTKFPRSSPFRATQLWNEAVSILKNGMPTRRHFYRMRYFDNCFSGREAVEWLSRALANNPSFGSNVTTQGTHKLLQHFLKSGVFQSLKGTLVFKESGLYEFLDRRDTLPSRKKDNKHSFSRIGLKEIDTNIPTELRQRPLTKEQQKNQFSSPGTKELPVSDYGHYGRQPLRKESSWKHFLVQRIHSLLPSLSVYLLVDLDDIQCDWVTHNICPEYASLRKKTELPFWVFSAITSIIRPQENESEYMTYTGFETDVYTVVRDYLIHRDSPMIPYCLYELFMFTFNHLHYLDLEMKLGSREHDSVENLVLSMSNEWNEENWVPVDHLIRTVLPPNSCFETAFTSDEPITRIVPQSSVDTLCLASYKTVKSSSNSNLGSSSNSQIENMKSQSSHSKIPKKMADPLNKRTVCKKYKNRRRNGYLRRTQSVAQIDTSAKWNTLPMPASTHKSGGASQQQSYINYGLSQSMDDLLAVDDNVDLDLEEAMQSVNCLLRASCAPRPPTYACSTSDADSSSSDSQTTAGSSHANKTSLISIDSYTWFDDIQETARKVFQSMLMLMSPASRTSLRMLLQFIDHFPVLSHSTITKAKMVYELSKNILSPGPDNKHVYSHHNVVSVVYFLVDNWQYIFEDFQDLDLLQNKGENQPVQEVYCEQLTRHQFEDQGMTISWLALAELLDQIITDKKMKRKEKKKRLKQFKDAYPHIYEQRFGGSSTSLSGPSHFR